MSDRLSTSATDRLLAGRAVDGAPELTALVAGLRGLAEEPVAPRGELAALLREGFDPATRTGAADVPAWAPATAPTGWLRHPAVRVAGLSVAAKVLLGSGVAVASVGTAAGFGALPAPVQDGVAGVVSSLTPFELPRSDDARPADAPVAPLTPVERPATPAVPLVPTPVVPSAPAGDGAPSTAAPSARPTAPPAGPPAAVPSTQPPAQRPAAPPASARPSAPAPERTADQRPSEPAAPRETAPPAARPSPADTAPPAEQAPPPAGAPERTDAEQAPEQAPAQAPATARS